MKLHHQISGTGSPLIILHGLFGTLDNWGSQISTLNQHFQVIAVDLRNHGLSPHCDTMDYPLMAADVIELMDDLKISSAAIIGHSMGGKVAMQIALEHPKYLKKLVIVDIAPVNYTAHHDNVFKGLLGIDLNSLQSRASADTSLAVHVPEPAIRAFLLKNLYRTKEKLFAWRPNISALHAQYHNISKAPVGNKFLGETLFIKGNNSDYMLAEHQPDITRLFEQVKFKIIEGAGHWPHAEKPKVFSSIILKFLDENYAK